MWIGRDGFTLCVPVYELARWQHPRVQESLHDALGFLTGDLWEISFVSRNRAAPPLPQDPFPFSVPVESVIAYSDGLDSRAVAGLLRAELGDRLVPVRLGTVSGGVSRRNLRGAPFTGVPYAVRIVRPKESSARSRGFKFAVLSGIAAHLIGAKKIVIPESGQGAIGPAMVPSGRAYADYRNHPSFTVKMERFLEALFGTTLRFDFPRLWSTKGETLKEYAALAVGGDWPNTRSCWRDQRWCSVEGKHMQCGICAACMLRRMSVHAAGLEEESGTYITSDLGAESLKQGTHAGYKLNLAHLEYAKASVLHIDHLANLAKEDRPRNVRRHASLIGRDLGEPVEATEAKLRSLLDRHASEWSGLHRGLGRPFFSWPSGSGADGGGQHEDPGRRTW